MAGGAAAGGAAGSVARGEQEDIVEARVATEADDAGGGGVGPATAAAEQTCSGCSGCFGRGAYSGGQWKKGKTRRCKACIAGDRRGGNKRGRGRDAAATAEDSL